MTLPGAVLYRNNPSIRDNWFRIVPDIGRGEPTAFGIAERLELFNIFIVI